MIDLARNLERYGARIALRTEVESVSYAELARRADAVAEGLGQDRRLVLVCMGQDVASVVGYLGALRGGHAVLLAPDEPVLVSGLDRAWDPDAIVTGDEVTERRRGSAHRLHPELALLLATSGSTGTPRLVRLSAAGVDANVAGVAEGLGIRPDDRAVVMLPLHYCYGLSILHTNLACGASLLLPEDTVTDPAFWEAVRTERATSLHGVPRTFELLDAVGFAGMALPHLRYVTQAGGRLGPDDVVRWAELGSRQGWEFVVMYGQTEATARMAILDPELAHRHPASVGTAVRGSSFTVEPVEGFVDAGVGELVHIGPNVMFGYAGSPADLALGRSVHALRTGDLGRVSEDGLVEIVGRLGRFVKPCGVRVDLDGLERGLAEHGVRAACAGDDETIVVAVESGPLPAGTVRELFPTLPVAPVIVPVGELPRRPNGKVDHPAVLALGLRIAAEKTAGRGRPASVQEVFVRALPGTALREDATFIDLGGSSLTYVRAAADLEAVLGRLPEAWDRLPLRDLAAMTPATADRRSRWCEVETAVALRAVAIVLIVGVHAGLWSLLGGAHLLLALSGWTFARFVLAGPAPVDTRAPEPRRGLPARILRSAALIAVPSACWIALRAATEPDVAWSDALLLGSVLTPLIPAYWFVAVLTQALIVAAGLFAVPAVRRLERRYPFGFPVVLLGVALVGRFWPVDTLPETVFATHRAAWLVVLGWLVFRAVTVAQRSAVAVATVVLVGTFFPIEPGRAALVAGGVLMLMTVPRLTLPRPLAGALTALAAASLAIYLTHFAVLGLEARGVPDVAVLAVALGVGLGVWSTAEHTRRAVSRWRGRVGSRRSCRQP